MRFRVPRRIRHAVRISLLGGLLAVLGLSGCALWPSGKPKAPPSPEQQILAQMTEPPPPKKSWFAWLFGWWKRSPESPKARPLNAVGRVYLFNAEQRYAVIESAGASGFPAGTPLVVIQDGNVTAHLEISPQVRPPFVIANVKSGKPQKDDLVYIDQP